ncbi:protein FAM162B-like [Scyliorhinus canicula]|uniref:protein FAM162B-like n=1 Tax=Scyliorhinus canicula TaxID=7830 RepID=UPI0018F7AF44|nr:protein FAM162B-like [Scyliorhinus canicula]
MWRGLLRARSLLPAAVTGRSPTQVSWLKPNPRRSLCSKVNQDSAVKATDSTVKAGSPELAYSAYKPGRIPSTLDKKFLLWSGRFKTEQDIPEMVSIEMLYSARNKIRVKMCYLMIGLTAVACLVMVVSGKKAFKKHENLTKWNLEKKAKLKEQFQQEQELLAGKEK